MMTLLPLACATTTALLVGTIDHFTGRMPNWITLPSLLLGTLFWSIDFGSAGLVHALSGAILVGSGPLVLFFFSKGRAIGGGDVKALGALGGWLGAGLGLEVALVSFCVLALYAIAREGARGGLSSLLRRTWDVTRRAASLQQTETNSSTGSPLLTLRFGPALIVGTVLCCGAEFYARLTWVDLL